MPNESHLRNTPGQFVRTLRRGVAAGVVGLLAATSLASDVIREGTGARRDALDAMELKPFDSRLWSELSGWTNGEPLDASATDGKVVVIYTFSSFLSQSLSPIVALDRLQQRHAEDGLIVVGVHHPEGWDNAARQFERRRGTFRIAHDKNGAFREALNVDQDPDLYVIDRAGQLRYADIETGSVTDAVTSLLDESARAAGSVLDRRAAAAEDAAQQARRSAALRAQVDLASLPEVPFAMPGEEAFNEVDWPKFYKYEDPTRGRGQSNDREEDEPRPISLPDEGNYKPGPPPKLDGRVTMIYFWTPERGMASWNEFYDEMQGFQREHPRDLTVVGVAVPLEQDNRRRRRGNDEDERQKEVEEAKKRFEEFFDRKPLNHTILDQIDDDVLLQSIVNSGSRRGSDRVFLPYVALISSDGKLRWHGIYTWQQEEFRDAFYRLLRDDPGLIARRRAEAEFIRQKVTEQMEEDG